MKNKNRVDTLPLDLIASQTLDITRGRSYLVILTLLGGDILSIVLAFGLATLIRSALIPVMGGVIHWAVFLPLLQLNLATVLVTYALTGLYPGFGRTSVEELQQIITSLTLSYGVLGLAVYFQQVGPIFSRSVFIMGWVFACLFNTVIRFAIRNRISLFKWWGTPVVVIGGMSKARDVIQKLLNCRRLGLRPVLLLDESPDSKEETVLGIPVIQLPAALQELSARHAIRSAVFVEELGASRPVTQRKLNQLSRYFPNILVVLSDSPLGSLWVRTMDLEGRLVLRAQYHLLNQRALIIKRLFDLVTSAVLLVLLLPFFLIIALLIKADSPGPVLYKQTRLGQGGKKISFIKFRTMVVDAEQRIKELLEMDPSANEEYQKYHKLTHDPRITRTGRFLRKYSLDESSQILHVLKGDLSLVGPRAYMPEELEEMGSHAGIILQIRPGLTGWWQVMGRHATSFEQRLQLDEYYISNWSLWLDIYIILKTGWVLLRGEGA